MGLIGNTFGAGNPNSGRPAMFEEPEQLHAAVTEWLSITPVGTRTITGLCLYLGFETRQSFYDYEKKDAFTYVIKNARLIVENDYELSLRSQSVTGAIFALKNMGWRDKTEMEMSGGLQIEQITGMQFKQAEVPGSGEKG